MAPFITKIRLINFRRFKKYTIEPNKKMNILVGDNETGKSSILEAIDLVTSGSIHRVETIGLDRLINIEAVKEFNSKERRFENLPILKIELYLSGGNFDFTMCGKNNTSHMNCNGIRLVCEPNPDYRAEIASVLSAEPDFFPYDYYSIRFSTFADESYTGYKKKIRSILIDASAMNSEYATSYFVNKMYQEYTEQHTEERAKNKNSYRIMRADFQKTNLKELNNRVPICKGYTFGLKGNLAFESELMIYENEIAIDNKGTGKQIIIKTDFALEHAGDNVDIILIEEPESHLSPVNLRKLIQKIEETHNGQLFITTHNSLISTRLELRNLLIMHANNSEEPIVLKDLTKETAQYFLKAPPAGIIEFALSNKAILVEGPSEYMLMERFYKECTSKAPEADNVHVINVRGLSFKRYLDIAKLTNCKVAVITDNDKNHTINCDRKYMNYATDKNIGIFYEEDDEKWTFEVVLYEENSELCNKLFGSNATDYMLNNKTEAAYKMLSQEESIVVPGYIKKGIEWIKE